MKFTLQPPEDIFHLFPLGDRHSETFLPPALSLLPVSSLSADVGRLGWVEIGFMGDTWQIPTTQRQVVGNLHRETDRRVSQCLDQRDIETTDSS